MSGMIRGRARAVRLPALAPVLAHRPSPEVPDPAELHVQPVPAWIEEGRRRRAAARGARQEARALADDHAHAGDPAKA